MSDAKTFRNIFLAGALCAASFLFSAPLRAQSCDLEPEVITKLIKPVTGAYSLWDTVEGDRYKQEKFTALAHSLVKDSFIAAGEVSSSGTASSEKFLLMYEIDRRGRAVWKKEHKVDGLSEVTGFLPQEDGGGIVLANVNNAKDKRKSVWLGFHDKKGNILHTAAISDVKFDISSTDFLMSHGGQLLVSAVKEPKNKSHASSTALYWVSLKSRKVTKDVTFAFGAENRINALKAFGADSYIGAGSVRGTDGRLNGWAILINAEGGFLWQMPYMRGLGGRFNDIADFNGEYITAVGEVMPVEESGRRAAWVAMIEAQTGNIVWQRYYRDDHEMSAVSVVKHEDAQMSVAINAYDVKGLEAYDYVRLITLNPRGYLLSTDSYFNAVGAQASGMLFGKNKERLVFGGTDVVYYAQDVMKQGEASVPVSDAIRTRDSWIIAASRVADYVDPCVKVYKYLEYLE